ncbi:MAG: hypothetical protein K0U36_01310, partial [Alphaproteobacteria bacterium]|nr:hypothetical protein [Alphaproteobacteria bacterium]
VKFRSLHEYVALQFKGHPVAVDRAYLRIRQGKLVLGYEKISTIGTEPSEGLSLGRSRLVFSLLGLIRGNFFPEALELDDTVIVVNRQFSGDTEVSLHRWKEEDGATTQASQYLTSNAEFAFVIPKNASEAGQGLSLPEALGFSTFPILRTENTRVFLFDEVSSQNYRFHAHVLTVETVGGVLKLNVLTTIDLGDAVPSVQSPLQLLVDGELLIDPTAYVVAYNGELVARGVDALFARSSASEQTSNGPARAGEASVLPTMGREYSLDMTGVYLGQSQSIRVEAALKADQQALCQLQLNNTGILSITELLRQDAAGATQDPAARLRADAQVLEASDRVDIANPENNVGNFDQALEYATADQGETDQGILSDADDAPAAPAARDAPEAPDEALADADEADAAPDAPDAPDAPAPAAPAAPDEADASPDAPGTHGAPAPAESDAAQATEATEARQAIHSVITASFTQCDMPALVRLASANLPPDFQAFGQMNADLQVVLSSTESVFPLDESPSRVPVLGRWQPLATKLAWHSDRITVESPTIWAEKQVGFDQIGGEAIMNFAEAALSVTSKNTTDNGTELHVNLQSTAAEIDWKEISNAFHASQLIPSLDSAETPSQYSGLPQRSVADRVAATLGEAPATPATPAADQLAQALQRMTLAFSAPTLNPRDVKTLWPVVLQPKARTWITSNVTAYQAEDFALTAAVAIEFPQPSDNTASDNAGSDNAGSDNASPDSAPRRASRAEAQSPNKATPLVTQAADATADASSTAFPLSLPNGQKALEESAYATPSLPKDKSYTLRGDAVEVGISNIAGSWEMSNARVRFSAGLPPITDVHGNVDFNGAGLLFRIDNARHNAIRLFPDAGHHLLVRPITTAELADLDRQEYRDALGNWVGKLPFFLEIDATMKAPLPTLLAVADSPAYQLLTPRGVPWQGLRGNADTRLRLQFPLFGDLAGHEITFDVLADIYEFSFLDSPVLEIDVYAEHLPVSLNNQEARVEGAAITLDGEPALIRWEEDFVADTQRTVLIETAVNPATIARHLGDEAVQFGGIVGDAMVFVTATQQRGEPGHRATFDVTLDPVAWEIASIPIARKVTGDRAYLNATFTQQPIAMEGTFAVPTHSQGQFRVVFDEQRFAGVTLDSQVPASVFGEWLLNSSDLLSGT